MAFDVMLMNVESYIYDVNYDEDVDDVYVGRGMSAVQLSDEKK